MLHGRRMIGQSPQVNDSEMRVHEERTGFSTRIDTRNLIEDEDENEKEDDANGYGEGQPNVFSRLGTRNPIENEDEDENGDNALRELSG